jgi:hypothetical protein
MEGDESGHNDTSKAAVAAEGVERTLSCDLSMRETEPSTSTSTYEDPAIVKIEMQVDNATDIVSETEKSRHIQTLIRRPSDNVVTTNTHKAFHSTKGIHKKPSHVSHIGVDKTEKSLGTSQSTTTKVDVSLDGFVSDTSDPYMQRGRVLLTDEDGMIKSDPVHISPTIFEPFHPLPVKNTGRNFELFYFCKSRCHSPTLSKPLNQNSPEQAFQVYWLH